MYGVKISSSTLPRVVIKDVIHLMRFDINRLPRHTLKRTTRLDHKIPKQSVIVQYIKL